MRRRGERRQVVDLNFRQGSKPIRDGDVESV